MLDVSGCIPGLSWITNYGRAVTWRECRRAQVGRAFGQEADDEPSLGRSSERGATCPLAAELGANAVLIKINAVLLGSANWGRIDGVKRYRKRGKAYAAPSSNQDRTRGGSLSRGLARDLVATRCSQLGTSNL